MRIVFLDFDGVLNNDAWERDAKMWFESNGISWWMPGPDSWRMLCPALVELLNQLLQRTGAKVVVSSSWRNAPGMASINALQQLLNTCGFRGDVVGFTPRFGNPRGNEIQAWLDSWHGETVESFVILDDDLDMKHLSKRLVRTNWRHGLTQDDVDRAVAMLTVHMQ